MMTKSKGFTLVELLIVLAILGMLAALVGPALIGSFSKGQRSVAAQQIDALATGLDTYAIDVGRYPRSLDGLIENDTGNESWDGPYLRGGELPADPWGNDYVYEPNGRSFTIMSYGADGLPGGEDENADIVKEL